VLAPALDDGLRFGEAVEDFAVQKLVTQLRVEALQPAWVLVVPVTLFRTDGPFSLPPSAEFDPFESRPAR